MRPQTALLSLLLVAASCKGDGHPAESSPPSPTTFAPAGQHPVALFLAEDDAGKTSLFQLAPGGSGPDGVAGFENVTVAPLAAAAAGGQASAFLITNDDGEKQLWRGPSLDVVPNAPAEATAVLAVSDDGSVIVVRDGNDRLTAVGANKTIDTSGLGVLKYGVALSRDGNKLAFSVMQKSCASSLGEQATCPVALYGVDLTESEPTARKLAGDADSVAYDPEFVDPPGTTLLYMTNAADKSPACRVHVNSCGYEVRSIPFTGGPGKTVRSRAVLARIADDGSVAYRRNEPPLMFDSHLYVGDKAVLEVGSSIWLHRWSPNSRWLAAITRRDQESFVEIVDRDGGSHCQPVPAEHARLIGWSARPLPSGQQRLAEPASVRSLRRAVQRARSEGGPVAIHGVSDYAYAQAGGQLQWLEESRQIPSWTEQPDALLIIGRDQYCANRRSVKQRLAAIGRFGSARRGSDLLLLRRDNAASKPGAASPALARFAFADGGVVELVRIDMPRSAQWTQTFDMTLQWRVVSRLDRESMVFVHLDHVGERPGRISADHVLGLCYPSDYAPGEVVEDTFEVTATDVLGSASNPGTYRAHVGWLLPSGARAKASSETLRVNDERVELNSLEITEVPSK